MKRIIIFTFLITLICVAYACKPKKAKLPKLDLLEHGFPISIQAPASATVTMTDYGVMREVTIKDKENYNITIFKSQATTKDLNAVKQSILADVKNQKFFSKIIEEYPDGFIYEKKIGERTNYDFRYIQILGSDEYMYQTGLSGNYSLEEARDFYEKMK